MSDEIEYDCSPWAGETRRILRSVLSQADIPHAWEGTVLVVPADFEEQVDRIVDEVDSTSRSSLGSAREKVPYDVSPWSAASLNKLVNMLVEGTVPHEWDAEGDLLVHVEDEEVVDQLIKDLGEPDGAGDIDGLELHDRLGKLFVAVDRLAGNPGDSVGLRDIEGAYEGVESAPLPYGIDPDAWLGLHTAAGRLLAAIGGEDLEEASGETADSGGANARDDSTAAGAAEGPVDVEDQDPDDPDDPDGQDGPDDPAHADEPEHSGDPDDAADLFDEPTDPVQESARALRDLLRSFV